MQPACEHAGDHAYEDAREHAYKLACEQRISMLVVMLMSVHVSLHVSLRVSLRASRRANMLTCVIDEAIEIREFGLESEDEIPNGIKVGNVQLKSGKESEKRKGKIFLVLL